MEGSSEAKVCPQDGDCGVSETLFPLVEKCFGTRRGTIGMEYYGVCPYCSVLTLPIDSSSLEIVTFFECRRYGYGRRVKGSAPFTMHEP